MGKGLRGPALVLLLLIAPKDGYAAHEFEKVGTIGAQFLKIAVGARATAMACSFVAVADDPSSVYWNPAGLARTPESRLTFDEVAWFADVRLMQASYTFRVPFFPGAFAVQARDLSMGQQPVRTVFRPDGDGTSFDAGDILLGASYARMLTDKFSTGVTVNYIQSTLDRWTASAVCFDFGTIYDTGYRSLRIGMSIRNIGSEMTFIEQPVKLPTSFQVGMAMKVLDEGSHRLLLSGEFQHPPDNAERACMGLEYSLASYAFLRGGLFFRYDQERFAAGGGVRIPAVSGFDLQADYSYTENRYLPGVHRFGVDLIF